MITAEHRVTQYIAMIETREAGKGDVPRLFPLISQIEEFHRNSLPDVFRKPSEDFLLKHLESFVDPPRKMTFISETAGKPIGYVHVEIKETPETPMLFSSRWGLIDAIVVDPSFRNKGVGKILAKVAEDWLRGHKVRKVQLNAWSFNTPARNFYENLGYTVETQKMSKSLT